MTNNAATARLRTPLLQISEPAGGGRPIPPAVLRRWRVIRALLLALPIFTGPMLASALRASGPCPQAALVETTPPIDNESDFCEQVAISGNTLVVGAPELERGTDENYGGAYVYTRTSASAPWALQQILVPTGPAVTGANWGHAIAIDGNTIALARRSIGSGNSAVCIFTRSGSTWTERTQIVGGPSFGSSVALEGTTLVVGCPTWPFDILSSDPEPGAVFVYTGSGATWTLQDRIDAPVYLQNASFGRSVAISGTTIAAGLQKSIELPGPDNWEFGAVSLYTRSGSQWNFQQTVQPFEQTQEDEFGSSLALRGNTLLVGAPNDPSTAHPFYCGSAFVFTRSGNTWSQYSKVNPIDPDSHHRFAHAVALANESFAAISSGDYDGVDPVTREGSVAITFELSGGLWLQRHDLTVPTIETAYVGKLDVRSVCLSGTATEATVVVGAFDAPVYLDSHVDKAHTFATTTGAWARQQSLVEPRFSSAHFSTTMAMQGNSLVVGAPDEDLAELTDAGTVRLRTDYDELGLGTTYWQKLTASDAASFDYFGGALAIDGDTVAVGATGDNNANGSNAGAVYIFSRSPAPSDYLWVETQKLIAPDGAAADGFGNAVALRGNTLLIGASGDDNASGTNAGAVYFYSRSGSTWTFQRKIGSTDLAAGDEFGQSIAIAAFPGISFTSAAIIGAYGADVSGRANAGAAYIFAPILDLAGTTWTQRAKLTATDNDIGDNFGVSVALWSDGTAVVGSLLDDHSAGTDAGSVYVFGPVGVNPTGSSWTQRAKLTFPNALAGDRFGSSVAIAPNTIAVGAPQHGIFDEGGAATFVREGGIWSARQTLFGINPVLLGDTFGTAVALTANRLAIGAPLENNAAGTDAGAAFLYEFIVCTADFSCGGGVTADDIFAFLDAWFTQNGQIGANLSADINDDNQVNADDIFAFLDAWFAADGECGM